ncbi:hypothetical protein HYQ46_012881 [Verticillium longisporum]|nr:hypothetical protein HYQ46_012881 [Verticillium longisporum]
MQLLNVKISERNSYFISPDECDLTGFQKASQRIYDVYIRPIQWTLDLVIAHPHTFAPDSACWERVRIHRAAMHMGGLYMTVRRRKRASRKVPATRAMATQPAEMSGRVLNNLFVAEGPKALGVLAALAELNHGLTIASKKGKSRQILVALSSGVSLVGDRPDRCKHMPKLGQHGPPVGGFNELIQLPTSICSEDSGNTSFQRPRLNMLSVL